VSRSTLVEEWLRLDVLWRLAATELMNNGRHFGRVTMASDMHVNGEGLARSDECVRQ